MSKVFCPICESENVTWSMKCELLKLPHELRIVTDCKDCGKKRSRVTADPVHIEVFESTLRPDDFYEQKEWTPEAEYQKWGGDE